MLDVRLGHCLDRLRELPDASVQCVVTSPPYWGLRDYDTPPQIWGGDCECPGHEWKSDRYYRERSAGKKSQDTFSAGGQANAKRLRESRWREDSTCLHCGAWRGSLGLEPTYQLYIRHMVEIFAEVHRVLKPDGTLWLNLGDCYISGGGSGRQGASGQRLNRRHTQEDLGVTSSRGSRNGHEGKHRCMGDSIDGPNRGAASGLKPKDIAGIPWRVAFALQNAGWYLRMDIVWHKPSPMPESVRDRPTRAHEYLFLLTKSPRYYYDSKAIKEPVTGGSHPRGPGNRKAPKGQIAFEQGDAHHRTKSGLLAHAEKVRAATQKHPSGWATSGSKSAIDHNRPAGVGPKAANGTSKFATKQNASFSAAVVELVTTRNKRSVWTIAASPYKKAHFATFPPALVRPCIRAGSRPGDVVLDPFGGSGTTGQVALEEGRRAILIELSDAYSVFIDERCAIVPSLPLEGGSAPIEKRKRAVRKATPAPPARTEAFQMEF